MAVQTTPRFEIEGGEIIDMQTGQAVAPGDFHRMASPDEFAMIESQLRSTGLLLDRTVTPTPTAPPPTPVQDTPARQDWLQRARTVNPDISDDDLLAYYDTEKQPEPTPSATLPTLDDWLPRAREVNPDLTSAELADYWRETYEAKGARQTAPGLWESVREGMKGGVEGLKSEAVGTFQRLQDPDDKWHALSEETAKEIEKQAEHYMPAPDLAEQDWYIRLTNPEYLGNLMGNTIVQTAPSVLAFMGGALVGGIPGGTAAMAATIYFQQAGATYREAFDRYRDDGVPDDEAHAKAYTDSGIAGLVSAVVNSFAVPASLFAPFQKTISNLFLQYGLNVSVDVADQITENLVAKGTFEPERPLMTAVPEATVASGLLSAPETMAAIKTFKPAASQEVQQQQEVQPQEVQPQPTAPMPTGPVDPAQVPSLMGVGDQNVGIDLAIARAFELLETPTPRAKAIAQERAALEAVLAGMRLPTAIEPAQLAPQTPTPAAAPTPTLPVAEAQPVPTIQPGTAFRPRTEPEPSPQEAIGRERERLRTIQTKAKPITPERIHTLAEARGIAWDDNQDFLAFTQRVTGQAHLDDLTQTELRRMADALQSLPDAELPSQAEAPGDPPRAEPTALGTEAIPAVPTTAQAPTPVPEVTPKTEVEQERERLRLQQQTAKALDQEANAAATSPTNALPDPTEAQKQAGNYQKGHVRVAGLDISIENPEGSTRTGVSPTGKTWSQKLRSHYGYIRGTKGRDKDHLDVFIKPGTVPDYTGPVYVVDQRAPETGRFVEHKIVLGASSIDEATRLYLDNYEQGWKGLRSSIRGFTLDDFKAWLATGDTTNPVGEPGRVQELPAEARRMGEQPRGTRSDEENAEVLLRAEKAQADMDIAGDERGTRVMVEQQGAGGTPEVRGLKSPTAQWYKDLTTGPGKMDRERIETAIAKIIQDEGVDRGAAVEKIKEAILADDEFRKTLWGTDLESILGGEWPAWVPRPGETIQTEAETEQAVPETPSPLPETKVPDRETPAPTPIEREQQRLEGQRPETKLAAASQTLANFANRELAQGQTISQEAFFAQANEAFGGTRAAGAYNEKDAYDALELGINQYIRGKFQRHMPDDPTRTLPKIRMAIKEIRERILERIPTQKVTRTEEQLEFQQFSTPPDLAMAMHYATGIQRGSTSEVVLEPSAGLGGLAVFAKNENVPVYVNELSRRRATLLRTMDFDRVFTENAEQLNNVLPKDIKPTVSL